MARYWCQYCPTNGPGNNLDYSVAPLTARTISQALNTLKSGLYPGHLLSSPGYIPGTYFFRPISLSPGDLPRQNIARARTHIHILYSVLRTPHLPSGALYIEFRKTRSWLHTALLTKCFIEWGILFLSFIIDLLTEV